MEILFFLLFLAVFYLIFGVLLHPLILMGIAGVALLVYFSSRDVSPSGSGPSMFHYELSPLNTLTIILLLVALMVLGERVLYDIARTFSGPDWNYFDNLQTIITQSMLILPVFILSIIINVAVGERKQKYAVALIPYLLTSILLTAQLSFQILNYFYYHHTNIQLYIVMALLVLISSVAIYVIQSAMPENSSLTDNAQ